MVRGSGRAFLDEESVELRVMDVLRVSPEVTRTFEAGPEGLDYLVFGPYPDRDGEVVGGTRPSAEE